MRFANSFLIFGRRWSIGGVWAVVGVAGIISELQRTHQAHKSQQNRAGYLSNEGNSCKGRIKDIFHTTPTRTIFANMYE
jgi:hypothetical protein